MPLWRTILWHGVISPKLFTPIFSLRVNVEDIGTCLFEPRREEYSQRPTGSSNMAARVCICHGYAQHYTVYLLTLKNPQLYPIGSFLAGTPFSRSLQHEISSGGGLPQPRQVFFRRRKMILFLLRIYSDIINRRRLSVARGSNKAGCQCQILIPDI